ncbi:MAG: hypothetical protein WCA08_21865 [Desulfoferrobacter sp.]
MPKDIQRSIFCGIDDKAHMVAEAESRNETNVSWIQADALGKSVQALLSTSDGILMRYFVLHMPDTSATIPRILSSASPGTHLWVFDLDTDYSACEPDHDAYKSFQDLVHSFCDKNSVEIRTGSMLPPILKAAGFQVTETAVEPFTNQEIDPELFANYLYREATLYHHFLEGAHRSERLRQIQYFLFNVMNQEACFVRYGMVMIRAMK